MRRAFTLVEVLITVALFVVTMLALTQLYLVFGRLVAIQNPSIEVSLDADRIVDTVRTFGLQANRVVSTHSFSGTTYTSGTTTVIFELPAVDSAGGVVPSMYDYVGVHASSTNVYRLIDVAAGSARAPGTKQLTSVLGTLDFAYDSSIFSSVTSLTVNATTSVVVREQVVQTHRRGHIYLRNL